jgi:1,4-alpha-glucan branching enzyme
MVQQQGEWVEFLFFRPDAQCVELAGDFNDWRCGDLYMGYQGDGYWRMRMRLPVGEYKFRYRADGVWYTDYAAFGVEPGQFGLDSLVRVVPRPKVVLQPAKVSQEPDTIAAA